MILLAGLLFQTQVQPLIQVSLPPQNDVSFCAAIPLPQLGYKDFELLEVGLKTIPKGSDVFSPGTIRQITRNGIEVRLQADAVLISFSVNKVQVKSGVDLMASLLMSPALEDEDLQNALKGLQTETPDYWSIGMNPYAFDLKTVVQEDVAAVVKRVFDPQKVTVAIGGVSDIQDAQSLWSFQTQTWTPAPPPALPDNSLPTPTTQTSSMTVAELVSGPIQTRDLPAQLLALYGLGWGKGSSLFRISRDRHAWSYRQETYLRPDPKGWKTQVFIPMIATPDAQERLTILTKELDDDVETWTEDDRARALGMAEANLLRFSPYGPLLLGDRPLSDSELDQVAMDAYWHSKTGADWDPQNLYLQMSKITLDQLKGAAHQILSESNPKIHQ